MSSYPLFPDPYGVWGMQAANPYTGYGSPQSGRYLSTTGRDGFTRSDSARRNIGYSNAAAYSGMPYSPGGAYGFNPFMMSAMYSPIGMGGYPIYPVSSWDTYGSRSERQATPSNTSVEPMLAPSNASLGSGAQSLNYNGVKINPTGFTDEQLKQVEKTVDLMAADPDGQKLLSKFKENGGEIKFDGETNNIAYSSGNDIVFGANSFTDTAYTLEVFGHELTHSVTQGDGNSQNEEALGSTLGRRIRDRYEDQVFSYQDENGKDVQFYGGASAEKESYDNGVQSAKNNPVYQELSNNTRVFNSLGQIGINFDFNQDPNIL